jgi:hypothetical protein
MHAPQTYAQQGFAGMALSGESGSIGASSNNPLFLNDKILIPLKLQQNPALTDF